jgi:hypothetical protein
VSTALLVADACCHIASQLHARGRHASLLVGRCCARADTNNASLTSESPTCSGVHLVCAALATTRPDKLWTIASHGASRVS